MNSNLVAISGLPSNIRDTADLVGKTGPVVTRLGGPLGIVGRVAGLGEAELDAGIPGWAWFGVGFVVGATAMYAARSHVARFMND